MKENLGRLFKIKPEKNPMNIDTTFKLLAVDDDEDGDEYFSIEWIQDNNEPRISKMYTSDLEYFFSIGDYYWV